MCLSTSQCVVFSRIQQKVLRTGTGGQKSKRPWVGVLASLLLSVLQEEDSVSFVSPDSTPAGTLVRVGVGVCNNWVVLKFQALGELQHWVEQRWQGHMECLCSVWVGDLCVSFVNGCIIGMQTRWILKHLFSWSRAGCNSLLKFLFYELACIQKISWRKKAAKFINLYLYESNIVAGDKQKCCPNVYLDP